MFVNDDQLKDFIVDAGLVSKPDLASAMATAQEKKVKLGDTLVRLGKITEDDLRKIEAHILGIPFVDLKSAK